MKPSTKQPISPPPTAPTLPSSSSSLSFPSFRSPPSPTDPVLACGALLLRAPLRVTHAARKHFPAGWRTADSVVVTHRLILIREGQPDYHVEGRRTRLRAGTALLVPAWCRREWTVSARGVGCALLWCEFSSEPASLPPRPFFRTLTPGEQRIETAALNRIIADRNSSPLAAATRLRSEGELKACLARFFAGAFFAGAETDPENAGIPPATTRRHPEITAAIAWLETHYTQPDALDRFYARRLTLSPNHFRLLFRAQTGGTVQQMLARLRLRKARYLVHETTLSMKEIAASAGFDDPLYFSQCYRRFWGAPPTADRLATGMA
ncbi:MAG: helix-turn-helix domain-containing protein [Opitutaceae bacterium]|nr:helix-turn-helix domain-containing protein [Opitutaceae bacterium]